MNKIWFKAKRYGWGWTPATWEGWAVTFLYILLVVVGAWKLYIAEYALLVLLGALILIITAYKKGEKPRWRWGSKDE